MNSTMFTAQIAVRTPGSNNLDQTYPVAVVNSSRSVLARQENNQPQLAGRLAEWRRMLGDGVDPRALVDDEQKNWHSAISHNVDDQKKNTQRC